MSPPGGGGREAASGRHRLTTNFIKRSKQLMLCTVGTWLSFAGVHADDAQHRLVRQFELAAASGQCVENVTYLMIREQGPQNAAVIVHASLLVLFQHAEQQRALGCAGDIAAQAIAAGADPDVVLSATAAGL